MVHVFVRHKVNDFGRWKEVFDSSYEMRHRAGEISARMFLSRVDPGSLELLCEWDSLDHAQSFFDDPRLKTAMQQAGVVGAPEIEFMEEIHLLRRTYAD